MLGSVIQYIFSGRRDPDSGISEEAAFNNPDRPHPLRASRVADSAQLWKRTHQQHRARRRRVSSRIPSTQEYSLSSLVAEGQEEQEDPRPAKRRKLESRMPPAPGALRDVAGAHRSAGRSKPTRANRGPSTFSSPSRPRRRKPNADFELRDLLTYTSWTKDMFDRSHSRQRRPRGHSLPADPLSDHAANSVGQPSSSGGETEDTQQSNPLPKRIRRQPNRLKPESDSTRSDTPSNGSGGSDGDASLSDLASRSRGSNGRTSRPRRRGAARDGREEKENSFASEPIAIRRSPRRDKKRIKSEPPEEDPPARGSDLSKHIRAGTLPPCVPSPAVQHTASRTRCSSCWKRSVPLNWHPHLSRQQMLRVIDWILSLSSQPHIANSRKQPQDPAAAFLADLLAEEDRVRGDSKRRRAKGLLQSGPRRVVLGDVGEPFWDRVRPEEQGVPRYHSMVPKPVWLQTIRRAVLRGHFDNCSACPGCSLRRAASVETSPEDPNRRTAHKRKRSTKRESSAEPQCHLCVPPVELVRSSPAPPPPAQRPETPPSAPIQRSQLIRSPSFSRTRSLSPGSLEPLHHHHRQNPFLELLVHTGKQLQQDELLAASAVSPETPVEGGAEESNEFLFPAEPLPTACMIQSLEEDKILRDESNRPYLLLNDAALRLQLRACRCPGSYSQKSEDPEESGEPFRCLPYAPPRPRNPTPPESEGTPDAAEALGEFLCGTELLFWELRRLLDGAWTFNSPDNPVHQAAAFLWTQLQRFLRLWTLVQLSQVLRTLSGAPEAPTPKRRGSKNSPQCLSSLDPTALANLEASPFCLQQQHLCRADSSPPPRPTPQNKKFEKSFSVASLLDDLHAPGAFGRFLQDAGNRSIVHCRHVCFPKRLLPEPLQEHFRKEAFASPFSAPQDSPRPETISANPLPDDVLERLQIFRSRAVDPWELRQRLRHFQVPPGVSRRLARRAGKPPEDWPSARWGYNIQGWQEFRPFSTLCLERPAE